MHFTVIAGLLFKNYYVILKGPNKFTSLNDVNLLIVDSNTFILTMLTSWYSV